MRQRQYRVVTQNNRFYVETRRWFFLWQRLMALEGWWSAETYEQAIAMIEELKRPPSRPQVVYVDPPTRGGKGLP